VPTLVVFSHPSSFFFLDRAFRPTGSNSSLAPSSQVRSLPSPNESKDENSFDVVDVCFPPLDLIFLAVFPDDDSRPLL